MNNGWTKSPNNQL